MADHTGGSGVHLPSPTPWPMVLALGVTLLAAGLVTAIAVSAVGAMLAVIALAMLLREDGVPDGRE